MKECQPGQNETNTFFSRSMQATDKEIADIILEMMWARHSGRSGWREYLIDERGWIEHEIPSGRRFQSPYDGSMRYKVQAFHIERVRLRNLLMGWARKFYPKHRLDSLTKYGKTAKKIEPMGECHKCGMKRRLKTFGNEVICGKCISKLQNGIIDESSKACKD